METCADYWELNGALSLLAAYIIPLDANAKRARMRIFFALSPGTGTAMDPALEHYSFRLKLTRSKTVGEGACGGCLAPMYFTLREIRLTQPVGVGDYRMQDPVHSVYASWNAFGSCYVSARNTTWGAIKAQYR